MWIAGKWLLVLALLVLKAQTASAQALSIQQPEIQKGEQSLQSTSTVNLGYRSKSDTDPRISNELSYSNAPRRWLELELSIDSERQVGGDFILDTVNLQAQVELRRVGNGNGNDERSGNSDGFGLGFLSALQVGIDNDSINTLEFGPILKWSSDPYQLTVNPFFETSFGRNSSPGLDFDYGWQLRRELRKGVEIGLEGFGEVQDIFDTPPWSEQDHRIGPGLYLEWEVTKKRELNTELGLLFGLTESTPAMSLRIDSTLSF